MLHKALCSRKFALASAFSLCLGMAGLGQAAADQEDVNADWTTKVTFTQRDGSTTVGEYTPLPRNSITKPWKICVLFPHTKADYWIATNYGTLAEAKRAGVSYQLYQAGSYDNLSKQVDQVNDCITQGFDAIIVGAISTKGLCPQLTKALRKGMPVIDVINGIDCPNLDQDPKLGHSKVSFYELGRTAGNYLKEQASETPDVVGFFPGPEGAGWSDDAVRGFNEAIAGDDAIKLVVTRRGDMAVDLQLNLITDALKAYPEINTVVGTDTPTSAAIAARRLAGNSKSLKLYAIDIVPNVFDGIVSGEVEASPTDFTTMQGRIATDMAIRLLEGKLLDAPIVGPVPAVVTRDNASSFRYTEMFAPRDFKATFSWEPE